jgi:hypothetical protein
MPGPRAGHVWLAGYVWAIARTCPIKTTSTVSKTLKTVRPKTLKTVQKLIFNGFWHKANRIYICVAHEQVFKNQIYIYIYIYVLKPLEHKAWIKFCINRIFDIKVYFSTITSFRLDVQQTKPHYENQ